MHKLLEIRDYEHLLTHISLGASWEGYVIEQIKKVAVPEWRFFFYRTQVGAEVDLFAITPTGKRVAIEIKHALAPSISKGYYESIRDLQSDYSYVIIPEGISYVTKDNITVMPLELLLTQEIPILEN